MGNHGEGCSQAALKIMRTSAMIWGVAERLRRWCGSCARESRSFFYDMQGSADAITLVCPDPPCTTTDDSVFGAHR
eukprot:6829763-Prymnesium_polylepis.1